MERSYGVLAVKEGGLVLVIQQVNGNHWTFCKGHKHCRETDRETAVRELREETNLEVGRFLDDEVYVQEYTFSRRKSSAAITKQVYFFLAEVAGTLALQKREVKAAKWLHLADAEAQLTYKEDKELLRRVKPILDEYMRVHKPSLRPS
jgi:8-oxo-dGTP pyrophosphatase MutT (NUDIX family)